MQGWHMFTTRGEREIDEDHVWDGAIASRETRERRNWRTWTGGWWPRIEDSGGGSSTGRQRRVATFTPEIRETKKERERFTWHDYTTNPTGATLDCPSAFMHSHNKPSHSTPAGVRPRHACQDTESLRPLLHWQATIRLTSKPDYLSHDQTCDTSKKYTLISSTVQAQDAG